MLRLNECIGVNGFWIVTFAANFAALQGVAIVRPFLGRLMEKVEIFGTQKEKFKPILRHTLPPQSIPAEYGGSIDFKPLAVY